MDQSTYEAHLATLKGGEMVVIKGRSALSKDDLHFAIKASGDTLPEGIEAPSATVQPTIEDGLEGKVLADLQDIAGSLGLTVTGEENKDALVKSIREVHQDLQHKP